MPKGRRNKNHLNASAGLSQYKRSGALSPSHSVRRALPALPGPIPQVEEAALFQGVTQASAEPDTGAILFGPSHNTSKTVGTSLSPEVDDGNSRALGMGQKPDGFSHPSLISDNIPLHNNLFKSPPSSAPSPSGDTPIKRPSILANSGIDPTTNGFYGLSGMEMNERQEGAREQTTNPDLTNTDLIHLSTFNDNIVSHSPFLFSDKTYKFQTFSI